MHLRTDWDGFLAELESRWPRGGMVYLARDSSLTLASAHDADAHTIICTRIARDLESVRAELADRGHQIRQGVWSLQAEALTLDDLHVGAVAYESDENRPGLWVDIFGYRPTPSDVIGRMLDEFLEDGSIETADADLFVKIAKPNIVILGPADIQGFLARNPAPPTEAEAVVEFDGT